MSRLIKLKRENYYLLEPVDCSKVVSDLKEFFEDYATQEDKSTPDDPHQRLGGAYSKHLLFKWEFHGLNGTNFNFGYTTSSPGSFRQRYDFKNIGGILVFPENIDIETISEIEVLLNRARLGTKGKITEILVEEDTLPTSQFSSIRIHP